LPLLLHARGNVRQILGIVDHPLPRSAFRVTVRVLVPDPPLANLREEENPLHAGGIDPGSPLTRIAPRPVPDPVLRVPVASVVLRVVVGVSVRPVGSVRRIAE